jgi:hypothetical protein
MLEPILGLKTYINEYKTNITAKVMPPKTRDFQLHVNPSLLCSGFILSPQF